MTTNLGQAAGTWSSEDGAFISESHARLAEALHDYKPYLSLVWIPPKDRDATDTKPFAILDSSPGQAPYIVRYLSEHEMADPTSILAWVFEGDLSKHRPVDVLKRMELRESAEQLLQMKQQMDAAQDQQEFVEYAVGNRSPHYM